MAFRASLDAELLILHLHFGSSADLDNSHTAGQLSQTLLQLLTVEIAGSSFDLVADLCNTSTDGILIAVAAHDGGGLLGDLDLTGTAQHLQGSILQLIAQVRGHDLTAGQGSDILQHLLTAIAEAGSLDSHHGEGAAQTVDDQGGQSLALDVLCHDQQLHAVLDHLLQQGQQDPE